MDSLPGIVALPAPIPRVIGGYRILSELGRGGMASVYLARRDGPSEELVAIKAIHPTLAGDRPFVDMFLREARIASQVSHPALVRVFEIGEDTGRVFLAMEYVSGESFSLFLREAWSRSGGLPHALAAHLIGSAADALHLAHELADEQGRPLGLVHRDVSPQNVMVGYDGQLRVLDFGIAKATQSLDETKSATLRGKVAYMAPEQIVGADLDRRTDVFALGVMLWEATLGRRLFKTSSHVLTADRILRGNVPQPTQLAPDYPHELERIVLRALAREPADRFPTARAFAQALSAFTTRAGEPTDTGAVAAFMGMLFPERQVRQREIRSYSSSEESETLNRLVANMARHASLVADLALVPNEALEAAGPTVHARAPAVVVEAPTVLQPRPEAAPIVLGAPVVQAQSRRPVLSALFFLLVLGGLGAAVALARSAQAPVVQPLLQRVPPPLTAPASEAPVAEASVPPPPPPPPSPPPPAALKPNPKRASPPKKDELLMGSDDL